MRLDHIAFRVLDRHGAAQILSKCLFYRTQQEFDIDFGNGLKAECIAMQPTRVPNPEIFLSDGNPGSIVGDWVDDRVAGGIHHIAFSVDSVEKVMEEWKEKGIVFTSDPIHCPEDNLIQVFTCPIQALGGIVIELIQRGEFGFCRSSVKQLMLSSVEEKGELT